MPAGAVGRHAKPLGTIPGDCQLTHSRRGGSGSVGNQVAELATEGAGNARDRKGRRASPSPASSTASAASSGENQQVLRWPFSGHFFFCSRTSSGNTSTMQGTAAPFFRRLL